jgi:hypothetical protein
MNVATLIQSRAIGSVVLTSRRTRPHVAALNVDDRRLSRYHDNFCLRPDAEISVDLSGEWPFEVNARAFVDGETGRAAPPRPRRPAPTPVMDACAALGGGD